MAANSNNDGGISMFAGIFNSDNSGIIQAGIAFLALAFSVYNMYQQKKSTQRQINLSLYEKRYKIYQDVIKLLDTVTHKYQLPAVVSDPKNLYAYIQKVGQANCTFQYSSQEREFLLDTDTLQYIQSIIDAITHFCGIVEVEFENRNYNIAVAELNKLEQKLNGEIKDHFQTYLDFKKI